MSKLKKYFEYNEKEINYLKNKDSILGNAIEKIGILKRPINTDIFSSLISCIVSQQISTKAAETVLNRLEIICNFDKNELNKLSIEEIKSCGMSQRKAEYIKNISDIANNNLIDFSQLGDKTDDEIINILTSIKGIGIWTAEMLLIFSFCRPDIISYSDLAIKKGIMKLYNLESLSKDEFYIYSKRYSPYASVASLYLWEIYSNKNFLL